jgi:hypothetical protein
MQVENRIAAATVEQLRARGHKVIVKGDWSNPTAPTMLEYDPASHVIRAGADVRGLRYALAW